MHLFSRAYQTKTARRAGCLSVSKRAAAVQHQSRALSNKVHLGARACAAQCCVLRRGQSAGADLLLSSLLLLLLLLLLCCKRTGYILVLELFRFSSGVYFFVPVEKCHSPAMPRKYDVRMEL